MTTKPPSKFYQPLAIGAPAPYRELPVRLERMIHFVPPHIEKLRAQDAGNDLAGRCGARQSRRRHPRRCQGGGARRLHRHGRKRKRFRRDRIVDPRQLPQLAVGARRSSPRSSPPSATSSTSSCCPRSKGRGTFIISISCSPNWKPGTAVKQADPDPRHSGNGRGRRQCGGDRRRLAAHARHEPGPGRSGRRRAP